MKNFNWRGAAKGFAIVGAVIMVAGALAFTQWQLMNAFGVWAGVGFGIVLVLGLGAWHGSKSGT